MNSPQNPARNSGEAVHPAPQRHRANRLTLAFTLFVAPSAWLLQLGISFAVAAQACHGDFAPLAESPGGALRWILAGIHLGAVVLAVLAAALAIRLWRRTRQEHHGSAGTLVDVGEGRTRFLALCAVFVSVGFLVALLFTGLGLLGVPLCGD